MFRVRDSPDGSPTTHLGPPRVRLGLGPVFLLDNNSIVIVVTVPVSGPGQ